MKISNEHRQKLYRYVKFDCDRLAQIIIQSKLYCSSPKSFNDPFDSKIQFTFQGCTDDDFRFFYRDYISNSFPQLEPEKINEMVEGIISRGDHRKPENLEKIRDHTEKIFQPEIDNGALLSLTEERDDILMWSHYGDGHKGLCLEFDKQLLDRNFICRKVAYDQPFPSHSEFYRRFKEANESAGETDNKANEATEGLGQFILCRKASHWEREHEWRIIIPWQEISRQNGERLVSYPEDMLTGIILGCKTDEPQRAVIEMMISKRSAKPILFKACKNDDEFKLDIRELDS